MNIRISSRTVRTVTVFFAAGGLVALGCSLVVDFDESKIPSTDSAVGADTFAGTPPIDTADSTTPPPDTTDSGLPDIVVDPGPETGADADDGDAPTTDGDAADVTDTTDAAVADTTDAAIADTAVDDTTDAAETD